MPGTGAGDAAFELEDLAVHYGALRAIHGLTVRCPRGAVGLLGPNGAGKSTLMKAVLGLVAPHSGRIRVLGLPVPARAMEVRRRVGYMPESPSYFPGLSGYENVVYAGQLSGMPRREARRRAHEMLEYVRLGEARYRSMDGYSAGMRQRVKLAAALVHDPDLLLLDEPTNGLDPTGRTEMLDLIVDLSTSKGLGVVLSSHLLGDVEAVCRSVLVLAEGELRAAGDIEELKQRATGSQVRLTLIGPGEDFVRAVRARGWEVELLDPLDPGDCTVSLPEDVPARILVALARTSGCQVRRFVPRAATLEEVFLRSLERRSS
jgi:ABC-2 type transport system ATP-binding protein